MTVVGNSKTEQNKSTKILSVIFHLFNADRMTDMAKLLRVCLQISLRGRGGERKRRKKKTCCILFCYWTRIHCIITSRFKPPDQTDFATVRQKREKFLTFCNLTSTLGYNYSSMTRSKCNLSWSSLLDNKNILNSLRWPQVGAGIT
jgi:hypothetical protein